MPDAGSAFGAPAKPDTTRYIARGETLDAGAAFGPPGDAGSAFGPAEAERRGYQAGRAAVETRMLPAHEPTPSGEVSLARRVRAMLEPSPIGRASIGGYALNALRDIPGTELAVLEAASQPFREPIATAAGMVERARRIIEPAARATAADIARGAGTMLAGPNRQAAVSEAVSRVAAQAPREALRFAYEHPVQTALAVLGPVKAGLAAIPGRAAAAVGAEAETLPLAERLARAEVSRETSDASLKPIIAYDPQGGVPAVRTRVNQVHPDNAPILKAIEESPDFQERLADLGGGEVISHQRTLAEALKRPPMTLDELAAARAEAPVDVARAGLLRSRVWNAYQQAGERGDFQAQEAAHALLEKIEPGYQNLTGNPARATEFQKVLQFNNDLWKKARELKAAGIPQEEATRQLNAELARASKDLGLAKLGKGWQAALDRLLNYTVAVKLTSPVTHAVNTISNTLTYAQRSAEQLTGAGYALVGQLDPQLAASMVRGAFPTLQGFRDGVRGFMDEFGEQPKSRSKFELEPPPGEQRTYPLPMRLLNPFRWLGAADAMWKGIITHQHLTSLAYETALRENALRVRNGQQPLRGQALGARVKGLVDNAPKAWRDAAEAQAAEYTFQDDPGPTVNAISRAVRRIPLLGRLTVPFVRTPANVARFYGRRTPIGLVASQAIRHGLVAGGRARAEAIGKVAVGTALQIEAFNAAQRGDIAGAPSSDPAQAALDRARGIKPYTIRVAPGIRLNYGRFSPQGLYLAQIAEIHKALAAGRTADAQKLWESALFRLVRGLKEQTFLSGISDAFDALGDPQRFFERYTQGIVTGATFPSVFRDVVAQMDPYVHQPRNMREAVQAMLPYLSSGLQPKLDIFGRPILQPQSRLLRATKVVSEVRANEATEILRASGYSPVEPRPVINKGGRSVNLAEGGGTPEATLYLFELGHATEAAVLLEGRKRVFRALPPEEQARILKRAITDARNAVRDRWAARYRAALSAAPKSTPGTLEE